jgi:hypothetical protein
MIREQKEQDEAEDEKHLGFVELFARSMENSSTGFSFTV